MNAVPPPLGVARFPPRRRRTFRPDRNWPASPPAGPARPSSRSPSCSASPPACSPGTVYDMQRWGSRPTDLDTSRAPFTRLDLNRADHAPLLQLARCRRRPRPAHRGDRARAPRLPRRMKELRHVSGIGPTMLERLRPFVYVERVEGDEDEPAVRPVVLQPLPRPCRRQKNRAGVWRRRPTPKKQTARGTVSTSTRRPRPSCSSYHPGVGPKLSSRIIETRETKPFGKVDDLRRVRGIGAKTLENLRPYVTVDPSAKVETNQ